MLDIWSFSSLALNKLFGEEPYADDMAVQPVAVHISSNQLQTVDLFNGEENEDVLDFFDSVETAAETFGWADDRTTAAAKSRLKKAARRWLNAQRDLQITYTTWATLKTALTTAFGETLNNVTAARAIQSLTQKPKETVQQFHDRIVTAINQKNFAVTDKTTAAYLLQLKGEIFIFMSAGLREDLKDKIIAGKSQPENSDELLKSAKNIERELNRTQKTSDVTAVETADDTKQDDVSKLQAEIAALKTQLGGRKCYNCNKVGHIARFCKAPQRNRGSKGNQQQNQGGQTQSGPQQAGPAQQSFQGRSSNYQPSQQYNNNGNRTQKKGSNYRPNQNNRAYSMNEIQAGDAYGNHEPQEQDGGYAAGYGTSENCYGEE